MIAPFFRNVAVNILLGVGILVLAELAIRDIAHVDVTGRPVAWLPIILSAMPLLVAIYKRKWGNCPIWKRIALSLLYLFILYALDTAVLVIWSCDNGVCM
jgi:hypothetical protein